MRHQHSLVRVSLTLVGALLLPALLLSPWIPPAVTFLATAGFLFTFVLPGLAWSFVVWRPGNVEPLERSIFAVAASIFGVTVITYFLSRLGGTISALTVTLVAGTLSATGVTLALAGQAHRASRRPKT